MNLLDAMAFAIIGISVLGAIAKGLIVELFSLGSVILGFVLACLYYDVLDVFFLGVSSPSRAGFLAFIVIFVSLIIIGTIAGSLLNRVVKRLHLKWMDRLLGGFFGLVRGWLVVSIVFLSFAAFGVQRGNMAQSRTAPMFLDTARLIIFWVPQDLKDKFNDGYWKALQLWVHEK